MLAKPAPWWPGIRRDHPLARGLRALWPFWEGAGIRAADLMDARTYATTTNADPPLWTPTDRGPAMPTANTGYWIEVESDRAASVADLSLTDDFTLDICMQFDATPNLSSRHFGHQPGTAGTWNLYDWVASRDIRFQWYAPTLNWFSFGSWITDTPGRRHQTITKTGAVYRGYHNGQVLLSHTNATPHMAPASPKALYFGYRGTNSPLARVEIAAIWNRALSTPEVIAHHADPFQLIRRPSGMIIKGAADLPPAAGDMGYTAQDARLHHTAQDARLHYTPPEGVPLHYTSAKP